MTIKIPGVPFVLDGDEYIIPPLPLGFLELHGDQLGGDLSRLDSATVKLVVDAVHTALRRNYPELPRDFVRDALDVSNFADAMQAVMDVSGLKRREIEAAKQGEPAATS
jgi:hypothetical protein